MKENCLAPFIRGALIAKTNRPWIVRTSETEQENQIPVLSIKLDSDDEKVIAEEITKTILAAKKIPVCVQTQNGSATANFFTAPTPAGIEDIYAGKITEEWDITHIGAFSSRCDVVKNRVVMVTGGAQGFGEEIVRGLIKNDAFVYIADLNFEGAKKLAQKLNMENGHTCAFALEVNVSNEESVQNMFETVKKITGGLDLCISNAGILRASSIIEQDIAAFKMVTDVNYVAFAIISKYCALLMKKQNTTAGSWMTDILQINSKSGLEGSNKNGSYAGGKFGGIGLVQSFALELIEYNIKVNAICPGNFYDGPLWSDPEKGLFVQYLHTGKVPGAKTVSDVKAFYEAKSPIHRGCTGDDVLKAVLYIVEQCFETGQAVPVTGGQVMLH